MSHQNGLDTNATIPTHAISKRPVVKEEVCVRKNVVEDPEVVEEDVRREEIDIDDETTTRRDA